MEQITIFIFVPHENYTTQCFLANNIVNPGNFITVVEVIILTSKYIFIWAIMILTHGFHVFILTKFVHINLKYFSDLSIFMNYSFSSRF